MARYEDYKPLRNRVRTYEPLSIILPAIKKLHEISRIHISQAGGYTPWTLLYLIKIAFLEGGKNKKKISNMNTLNHFLNCITNLGDGSTFLNGESGGLSKFMRTSAFQQFWFQRMVRPHDISRQLVIFRQDPEFDFNDMFLSVSNISVELFLQLLLSLWSAFIEQSGRVFITREWLAPLDESPETIDNFLHFISLPMPDAISCMEKHYGFTPEKLLQLTEQSPLKQYPFLHLGDKYYCYSPSLLQDKLKHSIYDMLKGKYKSDFTQTFGVVFERYIYRLMDTGGVKYLKEAELQSIFRKTKVCDAIVTLEDAILLLEVKAVEMHPSAQINPTNEELTRYLGTSVLKAFKQLYEVSNLLHDTAEGRAICAGKPIFALVVTYKEMYLSDGQDLWDEFVAEPLQAFMNQKGLEMAHLPLRNVLFASVETFEQLIGIVLANGNIISEIMARAVADNSAPETKKYLLEMHLNQYEKAPIPFLDEAFNAMTDELAAKVS